MAELLFSVVMYVVSEVVVAGVKALYRGVKRALRAVWQWVRDIRTKNKATNQQH